MSDGLKSLRNQRQQRRQAPPPDHPRPKVPRTPTTAPLDKLVANPHNPRLTMTEVEELAQSFRSIGQQQPVTAMTREAYLALIPADRNAVGNAEFVVAAGSRRLSAARAADLPELKIHVDDSHESASLILETALVENIHRVDLHPLEEARSLGELRDLTGLNQKELASRLGRTPAFVSQRLRLLDLTPEMQDHFLAGDMKIEQARSLAQLPPAEQRDAWEEGADASVPAPESGVADVPAGGGAETGDDPAPINDVNRSQQPDQGSGPHPQSHQAPARQQHEQLTLDLAWEPEQMVELLHQQLGDDKFNELAEAMRSRLTP